MTDTTRQGDSLDLALMAAVAAAWTALPDHIDSPAARRLIRVALLVAGGVVVGARAEQATHGTGADPAPATPPPTVGDDAPALEGGSGLPGLVDRVPVALRPVAVAGLAGTGLGVVTGGLVLGQKIDDTVAAWFSRRGVAHPYTATGLLWAALTPLVARLDPH